MVLPADAPSDRVVAASARRIGGRKAPVARRQTSAEVGRIAREQLVAALADQHDLHVLARQPREEKGGHERRIGERLVERACQGPHAVEEEGRRDGERAVAGAERAGGQSGVLELVEAGDVEADGEGRELVDVGPGERGDRGRIEAAGEEHAERDVAHERDLDRARELGAHLRRGVCRVEVERRGAAPARGLPVAVQTDAGGVEHQPAARRQLRDAGERARGPGDVALTEIAASAGQSGSASPAPAASSALGSDAKHRRPPATAW